MNKLKNYWWSFPVLGFVCYMFSGKASLAMTISDTMFLMGIIYLITGSILVIRNTGFFDLVQLGMKQLLAIVMNSKVPRKTDECQRSTSGDKAYKTPFLLSFALLTCSFIISLF
jgi:hypothetical protein